MKCLFILELMRSWKSTLVLLGILVVSCATAVPERTPGGAAETTLAPEPPPDLGPPPTGIPEDPLATVELLSGSDTVDPAALEALRANPLYVEGSVLVESFYPGPSGPEALLWYEVEDISAGIRGCSAIAPTDSEPTTLGCSDVEDINGDQTVPRVAAGVTPGPNQSIEIVHSPEVSAVVVELTDGSMFVIRPGHSSISYHRWDGAPAARFTVLWNDGTSDSVLISS